MPRLDLALLIVSVATACSFDWDPLDPRLGATGGAGGQGAIGGAGGEGGQGGTGGTGGVGGMPPSDIGCADGEREAYVDTVVQLDIAGCSGGFDVPGVQSSMTNPPACGRGAGDDGDNPAGMGCNATDLCSEGWHVCLDAAEVASKSSTGMCPPAPAEPAIWITRMGGPAMSTGQCDATGVDNLTGCGAGLGSAPGGTCAPLDHQLIHADCVAAPDWECGEKANEYVELEIVTKSGPASGGVLCCRD